MSHATTGLAAVLEVKAPVTSSFGIAFGTPVMTLDGSLPVEHLQPGCRVITRSGTARISEVHVTVVRNARVIRIGSDALGVNRPADQVVVSPDQPILIRDWRATALYGTAQAVVPASRLVDGEYIRAEVLDEVRFYALRFEKDVVIYAAGLELPCAAATVSA